MPADFLTSKEFISTARAASTFGRSRDYVARLARSGEVTSKRIGKKWFIDPDALAAYIAHQDSTKEQRARDLVYSRKVEYAKAQGLPIPKKPKAPRAPKAVKRAPEVPIDYFEASKAIAQGLDAPTLVAPAIEAPVHIAPQPKKRRAPKTAVDAPVDVIAHEVMLESAAEVVPEVLPEAKETQEVIDIPVTAEEVVVPAKLKKPKALKASKAQKVVKEKIQKVHTKATVPALVGAFQMKQVNVHAALLHAANKRRTPALSHMVAPMYSLAPLNDFMHRIVALVSALLLVFGTYAVIDRNFASFASREIQRHAQSFAVTTYSSVNTSLSAASGATQVANAVLADPAQLQEIELQSSVPILTAALARALDALIHIFENALSSHVQ